MADFIGGPMPGVPMPGPMGGAFGEYLNYNPSWIYGKGVSGGDKYAAQREPYDFSDDTALTLDEMYGNNIGLKNKSRAEISKKLYSINKIMTPLTKAARKNYAMILILQKMDELEAKYGKLSIPTSEINSSDIQSKIYNDLCVQRVLSSEFEAKPKLSPSTEFYDPEEEKRFIESFIKKVFNKRKNTKWRYDTLMKSGLDFQYYFNCVTGFAYHNYNVYKKLLGEIVVDINHPNLTLNEPMYEGMLPDLIDESSVEKKYEERVQQNNNNSNDNIIEEPIEENEVVQTSTVNTNPQPVNNNTSSNDINSVSLEDFLNGQVDSSRISYDTPVKPVETEEEILESPVVEPVEIQEHVEKKSAPESMKKNSSRSIQMEEEFDFWNDLVEDYIKTSQTPSIQNTATVDRKEDTYNKSYTRSSDEELIEMLSNIDDEEVDFTSGKGIRR